MKVNLSVRKGYMITFWKNIQGTTATETSTTDPITGIITTEITEITITDITITDIITTTMTMEYKCFNGEGLIMLN